MNENWKPSVYFDRFGSELSLDSLVFYADDSTSVKIGKIVKINAGSCRIVPIGWGQKSRIHTRKSGEIIKLTEEYATMYHLSS